MPYAFDGANRWRYPGKRPFKPTRPQLPFDDEMPGPVRGARNRYQLLDFIRRRVRPVAGMNTMRSGGPRTGY